MSETDGERLDITAEEARVLGCLLEKAATTPDLYPLSLNSLVAACNQKTNRHPVVDYDEDVVAEATEGLRAKKLAFRVDVAGSRTMKYRHNIDELLGLSRAGKALLAVLLLRGPQTAGELRQRTERMHSFADTEAVEQELDELARELDPPLWTKLPPAPGKQSLPNPAARRSVQNQTHLFHNKLPDCKSTAQRHSRPPANAPVRSGEAARWHRIAVRRCNTSTQSAAEAASIPAAICCPLPGSDSINQVPFAALVQNQK